MWESEADIVIVGAGAAGYAAAATAGDEGLGTTIVLEAAPEEYEGGNSRVCGQGVLCPDTVEGAIAYQTDLNGEYYVEPELIQAWAENICENVQWLTDVCGFEAQEKGGAEFPDAASADTIKWYAHQGKGPWEHTWQLVKDAALSYDTSVYYEARAIKLLTKDGTREVIGVQTEDGRNFKASKGVILACGGFENNQRMMNDYMPSGFPGYRGLGTWYNVGDGIMMAQQLGAQLWHMNSTSGDLFLLSAVSPDDTSKVMQVNVGGDDFIWIDKDGNRFINEKVSCRHGKMYRAGTWCGRTMPKPAWCIFGQGAYDTQWIAYSGFIYRTDTTAPLQDNDAFLDAGIITKCDDIAGIAAVTGIDEAALTTTVDRWNGFCDAQHDEDYYREIPVDLDNPSYANTGDLEHAGDTELYNLGALQAPYYVVQMYPGILNTQGGPKRGVGGEVLDTEGNPIPRLYSAGELGCIYAYCYNLGGNFSEAISSGRHAARTCGALEAWA